MCISLGMKPRDIFVRLVTSYVTCQLLVLILNVEESTCSLNLFLDKTESNHFLGKRLFSCKIFLLRLFT